MKPTSIMAPVMAAAALAILPAPALAKDNLADRANELAEQANDVQQQAGALANDAANAGAVDDRADDRTAGRDDHDGHFPWGILGLFGLAGLLGLKRDNRRRVDHDLGTGPRL